MSDRYDVAIAGAGPAGSSLAIRLASAGKKVLLVEQKEFPRPKLCGEFISPECLSHFTDLGLSPNILSDGVDIERTTFFARSGRSISIESEWFEAGGPTALGWSRAEMDAALLGRAREAGAEVREKTTAAPIMRENRVTGLTLRNGISNGTIEAGLVVDATGRTRSLARQIDGHERTRATHVAFKAHLDGARIAERTCEIYAYRGGYGGCNGVEGNLANLCFIASSADVKRLGSRAGDVMRHVVCQNRRAGQVLADAVPVSEWLAVPIERFGRGRLVPAENMITVGDSAAFIDPFTGSGILLALESGRIAADAILGTATTAETAACYSREYARAFDRRLKVCSFLRHTSFSPILAETAIAVLGLSSRLRRRVARATR